VTNLVIGIEIMEGPYRKHKTPGNEALHRSSIHCIEMPRTLENTKYFLGLEVCLRATEGKQFR